MNMKVSILACIIIKNIRIRNEMTMKYNQESLDSCALARLSHTNPLMCAMNNN